MKHIPFAALPLAERTAVLDALERCGIAPRQVCVSKLEPVAAVDGELPCLAMVSAPGWIRSYDAGAGWVVELEKDLGSMPRR
jgi:hypothetical protein